MFVLGTHILISSINSSYVTTYTWQTDYTPVIRRETIALKNKKIYKIEKETFVFRKHRSQLISLTNQQYTHRYTHTQMNNNNNRIARTRRAGWQRDFSEWVSITICVHFYSPFVLFIRIHSINWISTENVN